MPRTKGSKNRNYPVLTLEEAQEVPRAIQFALTELGREITSEDAATREQAKRKAMLNVEPFQIFLTAYNGKKIPAPGPFKEFLVKNADVPPDRVEDCIKHILADAQAVGFVRSL